MSSRSDNSSSFVSIGGSFSANGAKPPGDTDNADVIGSCGLRIGLSDIGHAVKATGGPIITAAGERRV